MDTVKIKSRCLWADRARILEHSVPCCNYYLGIFLYTRIFGRLLFFLFLLLLFLFRLLPFQLGQKLLNLQTYFGLCGFQMWGNISTTDLFPHSLPDIHTSLDMLDGSTSPCRRLNMMILLFYLSGRVSRKTTFTFCMSGTSLRGQKSSPYGLFSALRSDSWSYLVYERFYVIHATSKLFFVSLFHHYHFHQYHKSLSSLSFSLSPDLMFLPLAVAAQAQEITLKPCKNMDYLYKSINNFGTLSDHLPCFLSQQQHQRNCILKNIRQENYAKVLLFSHHCQFGINFAFVLTTKSGVKSIRQTRAENRRRIQCGHCADIYPSRYMSALCLPRETYILHEMLCGHCADIYLKGYMTALCISFFGFQLRPFALAE